MPTQYDFSFAEITRERRGAGVSPVSPKPDVSRAPAYAPDSDVSKAAAEYIEPFTGSLRARILEEIRRRGEYGATADELCIGLGAVRNSVAPRLTELRDDGLIRDSEKTRKMPGQNVAATVWILNTEVQS